MNDLDKKTLLLRAKIEFGPEHEYEIKSGGLGMTLIIDADTKKKASIIRKKAPTDWEGLYVMVIYRSTGEETGKEAQDGTRNIQ
jgi:hypothetical protein